MRIYRDILKQAWFILWHYVWLWPFGLLAALAGNAGEFNSLTITPDRLGNQADALATLRNSIQTNDFVNLWETIIRSFGQAPLLMFTVTVVTLLVTLALVWLVNMSQASLIHATGKIDLASPTSFTDSAQAGIKFFWPIFWLNLVTKFATYLILAVAFLPFLATYLLQGSGWSFTVLMVISFIVSVPVALILGFILRYAANFVVLENAKWWEALERAVNLFFKNWLATIEMALLLFVINLVLGLLMFIFVIPRSFNLDILILLGGFDWITLFRVLPVVIIVIGIGMWFSTYQWLAWTLLFRRIQTGNLMPKLIRLTNTLPNSISSVLNKPTLTGWPKK